MLRKINKIQELVDAVDAETLKKIFNSFPEIAALSRLEQINSIFDDSTNLEIDVEVYEDEKSKNVIVRNNNGKTCVFPF